MHSPSPDIPELPEDQDTYSDLQDMGRLTKGERLQEFLGKGATDRGAAMKSRVRQTVTKRAMSKSFDYTAPSPGPADKLSESEAFKTTRSTEAATVPAMPRSARAYARPWSSVCTPREVRTSGFEKWKIQKDKCEAEEKVEIHKALVARRKQKDKEYKGKGKEGEVIRNVSGFLQGSKFGTSVKSKAQVSKKVVRDLAEVRRIFDHFDEDLSGNLDFVEFVNLISRLMKTPREDIDITEVNKQWEIVDADGSGSITFEEFQNWYSKRFHLKNPDFTDFFSEEELKLSKTEIQMRNVAHELKMEVSVVEKLWKEFEQLDVDNSGKLEYDEFKTLITRSVNPKGSSADVPESLVRKFWQELSPQGHGAVTFRSFAPWYVSFFVNDGMSPMERYYKCMASGPGHHGGR